MKRVSNRLFLENTQGVVVRVVFVPFARNWLARFNKRFAVDKSSYDGRFTSKLGRGYCTAAQPFRVMEYTFLELSEPAKRVQVANIMDPSELRD